MTETKSTLQGKDFFEKLNEADKKISHLELAFSEAKKTLATAVVERADLLKSVRLSDIPIFLEDRYPLKLWEVEVTGGAKVKKPLCHIVRFEQIPIFGFVIATRPCYWNIMFNLDKTGATMIPSRAFGIPTVQNIVTDYGKLSGHAEEEGDIKAEWFACLQSADKLANMWQMEYLVCGDEFEGTEATGELKCKWIGVEDFMKGGFLEVSLFEYIYGKRERDKFHNWVKIEKTDAPPPF